MRALFDGILYYEGCLPIQRKGGAAYQQNPDKYSIDRCMLLFCDERDYSVLQVVFCFEKSPFWAGTSLCGCLFVHIRCAAGGFVTFTARDGPQHCWELMEMFPWTRCTRYSYGSLPPTRFVLFFYAGSRASGRYGVRRSFCFFLSVPKRTM